MVSLLKGWLALEKRSSVRKSQLKAQRSLGYDTILSETHPVLLSLKKITPIKGMGDESQ